MTITLATLKDATKQQIFDQVARHLLKQKVRAMGPDGACRYRTETGLMCAAGCLMSDEEYDPKYDIRGAWDGVVYGYPDEVTGAHCMFIAALQRMHDAEPGTYEIPDEGFVVDYPRRLERFAKVHRLKFDLEAFQE